MGTFIEKLTTGKMPIVIIVVCIGTAVALLAFRGGDKSTGPERTQTVLALVCEACGHEWEAEPELEIICPKCDAPGIASNTYICQKCGEEFVGLQIQRLGINRFKYRRPGDEWLKTMPRSLKCDKCEFDSPSQFQGQVMQDSGGDGRRSE